MFSSSSSSGGVALVLTCSLLLLVFPTPTASITSPVSHLAADAAVVIPPTGEHKSTLIWMHGLGDSAAGFYDLFLPAEGLLAPGVKVVLLNAPVRPITVNGGMRMRGWYDIYSMDRLRKEDEEGIAQSVVSVSAVIDQESLLVGSNKIVVGGFSQGAAMSVRTALEYPAKLAGVVALSGYVFQKTISRMQEANRVTPFFAYHGESDPVVPFPYGKEGFDSLITAGVPVEWHSERGLGHSLSPKELSLVSSFIARVLA
eukprot:GILJ01002516.1.p1 GENE.GILJ01002516.1~~GILJ01002516.1.p1  ORF type:complete len:281 (-),score=39.66 GILJ01002516.1:190-960(-)